MADSDSPVGPYGPTQYSPVHGEPGWAWAVDWNPEDKDYNRNKRKVRLGPLGPTRYYAIRGEEGSWALAVDWSFKDEEYNHKRRIRYDEVPDEYRSKLTYSD
jgi:hypothetical protein